LGVTDRIEFVQSDAGAYPAEPGGYDVVSCIGATWIGGGLAGTIELLKPALKPGGLMLIGEPYWTDEPPRRPDDLAEYTSLVGTLDRVEAAGMQLVEMVLADGDSWDRYAASQWLTLSDYLRDRPDDPDIAQIRDFLRESRRSYLEINRRYLGWGVFMLRAGD
jgi:SAM-dependent methyltransferase